jgi:hypothetical protein
MDFEQMRFAMWNQDEDEALSGLPLLAQVVYLRGLRWNMDCATRIVGLKKRRISLLMLAELAQVYINREIQPKPTKKMVRSAISQLKRAGLIEHIPNKDYLVFFLKLVIMDKSVQNNKGTPRAQQGHRDKGTPKTPETQLYQENVEEQGHTNSNAQVLNRGTHQETRVKTLPKGNDKDNIVKFAHKPDGKAVQEIFAYWQAVMGHLQAKLDPKRKKLITESLQVGYTVAQLKLAIKGCSVTPHNIGDNDTGQRYDGLHVVLRAENIDRFIRNSEKTYEQMKPKQGIDWDETGF